MFRFRLSKNNPFIFKKVKGKYKQDIEPQEIFLDNLANKKEKELGVPERKFEVPLSKKILQGSFFFVVLIFILLFVKTFQLQVLDNKKYAALSDDNKFIIHLINADRGVIYDSKGNQIVFNKPSFDLILNKDLLPEDELERIKILQDVSEIINQDYQEFENKEKVLENLDHQTLVSLETKINDLPGFHIKHNSIRYYKEGLSHIIGYTSTVNNIGIDGLEKTYENILKKDPGKIKIEQDVYGNILSKEIVSLPQSGNSLVLWLDSDLQKKIEQVLRETLENTGSKKAVGVALDPKTGGIMALVSMPSYDNNLFSKGANQKELENLLIDPEQPLFNRVISGLYPTGSTIKPLIAAAALEEEIISSKKEINCKGQISIPHRYDPDIIYYRKDWRIHGVTSMEKAIAESCNVYFYTIGGGYGNQEGLGPSRIKKYVELFGWGSKTGVDLPGEASGLIPYPDWKKEIKGENWWDGDTYNLSIGQGDISVTPLQVAASFVAIANGGTLFKPKVVKEIINNNVIESVNPEIWRQSFINIDNLEIIRRGMRKAVTGQGSPYASSVLLNSLPVSAAAKTGTAQTPIKDFYHNWITVFAPYEDPEIVLVIMIENVKDLQAAALPSAKNILQYYFTKAQ